MKLHRKPIPVKEAVSKVMERMKKNSHERVNLENSHNRYLGEDITASHPIPPFDKSPYDGFALHSTDTIGLGRGQAEEFRVIEQIGAGHRASRPLKKGEAVRIMTGAEIPEGADCVAMFEICQAYEKNGQSYMSLKRELKPGQNVIHQGSETKKGTVLVQSGTKINPGIKALLATFGYDQVKVQRKPKVGIFATGTELLDVDESLEPGKIRNSNAYMITAQVERAGAEAVYLGKLKDDFSTCFEAVSKAAAEMDILITTGGVSVGDFDLMPDIYKELGAEVLFNKIAMRPGSVTTVAEVEGKLLFGLSGNPSACYVGFELFTFPIIQGFLANPFPFRRRTKAYLNKDFPKANPFMRFVRGKVTMRDGKIFASPAGIDKSAVVTSLAETDAFIVLPGGTKGFKLGDMVEVILIEDSGKQEAFH
ncbi:molybdopterin molybdotransferase MoeA [Halobacillus salinarum]|uniref:Molybdopterin molybdenumtransferase n=1 Tax=Halobacillus salinarum TaxID=2932257 RepID=A0ABY4EH87_9BACI|nr:gephyrin-like molybdotransferase Glp [Halobacillus salinarum]UOQ43248.1 molybdopterin molybdotransferase MoeA [Halobacillus salinarum]